MIIEVLHLIRPHDYRENPANADLDQLVWNITFNPQKPELIEEVLSGKHKNRGLYYKPVAKISVKDVDGDPGTPTENLEIAYTFTNSIERLWTETKGIELLDGPRQRSTSVGDVLIADGVPYYTASFGFKRVDGTDHEAD